MKEEVKNCIEQAERFLVLREHNKNELTDKLRLKKYSQNTIDEAIKYLQDSDELNESRYIKAFIRSSNRKHPEGKTVVFARLFAKKADKFLAGQILEEMYNPEYVSELVKAAIAKVEKKGRATSEYEKKQELFKLGFTSSDINLYKEKISD